MRAESDLAFRWSLRLSRRSKFEPHFQNSEHRRSGIAFYIISHPGFTQPLLTIDNHLAAQEYFFRISGQHPAFVKIVISAVMGMRYSIFDPSFGIPDDDVGIRARQQAAFLRVKTEYFSRVGAGQGDELVGGDPAGAHPISPQHRQAVADPR